MQQPRRALLSVSDKTGLVPFAAALRELGFEIVSTGGTAAALRAGAVAVVDVAELTGFPEIMGGRVKTLHPAIHGALLCRRGTDEAIIAEHGIEPIDLLVVNLYPFGRTIELRDVSLTEAIENIDIGGPAMIRAAAKNHASVTAVVDPADYPALLDALRAGGTDEPFRRTLAAKAFRHTATYDAAIAAYLSQAAGSSGFDTHYAYGGRLIRRLRYGENPHQSAAFYRDSGPQQGTLAAARLVQGKELSYNNIADSDAALECVRQFDSPACVIVKHANPCGVAIADIALQAYHRAHRTDPTSAFGGIIAFNCELDAATAAAIIETQFVEVLVATSVGSEARQVLRAKKNVRVLETGTATRPGTTEFEMKKVSGGLLVQEKDLGRIERSDIRIVSQRQPTDAELADMLFAWRVVKYVKSNGIVFCRDLATVGIGAGQMSRVYSTRIAAIKAADEGLSIAGSVMASDAFFPFRDGIDHAAEHRIRAVIQPGGSIRDEQVIAAADEHGLAMAFTGMRHFRH